MTISTNNPKNTGQKILDPRHILMHQLRCEDAQKLAKQNVNMEFKLGLSSFAFAISKKINNEDQKFLQSFRESMCHFDRGMKASREIDDLINEQMLALMKYKIAEFSTTFLSNENPIPISLTEECISNAISVAEAYDVVTNPNLPKVHVAIRPFSHKKFGNLLKSENAHQHGVNNIVVPINNAYYLHIVQVQI